MKLSRHSLHHSVPLSAVDNVKVRQAMEKLTEKRRAGTTGRAEHADRLAMAVAPAFREFPLATVFADALFDAYINVAFIGPATPSPEPLLVDSGNTTLIVPRWEDIEAIPSYDTDYEVLGQATEPWGCPANVVRGPICLVGTDGEKFTIANCVFYACTADSPSTNSRTANFGAGCVSPWSASWSNVPDDLAVTMQSPLSYTDYRFVEFDYASVGEVFQGGSAKTVSGGSMLRVYKEVPAGYAMFDIVPNCEWMSLLPKSLGIDGKVTDWPGTVASPIAMIDTGGGPVLLIDPNGYFYSQQWQETVSNPDWASGSISCQSIKSAIRVEIGDQNGSYSYQVDSSNLPDGGERVTLTMCESNEYMRGQQGMNIGGISALKNYILIDFLNSRVGFKAK